MPSLHFDHPLSWFLLWNVVAFFGTTIYCSFFEWALHRFVMHKRQRLLPFPYELHAVSHHGLFGADETYHAQDENMRSHITFVVRDYILLTLVNLPVVCGAELLAGRPLLIGWFLATLAYLQAFNSLHWRWHVPSNTWFQRTAYFKWASERHRLHHGDPRGNFNLVVPLGDLLLGTWLRPRGTRTL